MNRALIIGCVVLAWSTAAPCQNTFMVSMDAVQQGYGGSGRSVEQVPGGFLVFGHQNSDDGTGRNRCTIYKLDATGTYQSRIELGTNDAYHSNFGLFDPICRLDSEYITLVQRFDWYSSILELRRFNESGEEEQAHQVLELDPADSMIIGTRQLRATVDGGYVFCGFVDPPDAYARAWLVKLDSAGAIEWQQEYGHPDQSYEAVSVAQYPDGGYVLAGYRLPANLVNLGFLIRTDSAGNELWRKHFGNETGSWGAVRVASDGGIVTFSSYAEQSWPWYWSQHMLTKWNSAGSIVWQTHTSYGSAAIAFDLEVLPDQSIITGGAVSWWAQLAKYSSEGDSLWARRFRPFEHAVDHLAYDVEPTSDGGFVLTGAASQSVGDPTPGLETIFVIKTDSFGCVVPGCQNVGVEEYVIDLQDHLHISPNPASDLVNVLLELPEGGAVQGQAQVQLLNASGRIVLAEKVQQNYNQLRATLDVSTLPAGTYYLHLRDGKRWLAGGKVVVQH